MNRKFLADAEALLMDLLEIPGVSCREAAVMERVVATLREAGAPAQAIRFDRAHRRSPYGGQIGNLALRLGGTRPGPRRLLVAHADTVPLCEGARPVRRGGFIVPADKHTGLGADDRSGAAVLLAVAREILTSGAPHGPLTFLWTVQEELGLFGARYLQPAFLGKPRLAFNFDGGAIDKLTVGATGGYRLTIQLQGIAAHAGVAPRKGVSAVTIAALAIAELHRDGWLGEIRKPDGEGTSNIGAIQGGEATNVVTPAVELRAEARSHDPVFRRKIVRAIERAFRRAARAVRNDRGEHGEAVFSGRLDYESFRLADDDPSLLAAEEAIRRLGGRPVRAISNGGLDANWLMAHGIAAVSLGCGQENGHTPAERLNRREFCRACRLALALATT